MASKEKQERQIAVAEKLQDLLLDDFRSKLESGEMTPTDRATLARLLSQNGWILDPAALPQGIESKLSDEIDPADLEDDDIIDLRRRMSG